MNRLPPLNALVAFRAVMETGSLVSAAQKLAITASAVSHRLKALEDHLGLELFERRSRAVFPTAAAYRYASEISEAFDRISTATRTIEAVGNRDTLSVYCSSSFASNWFLRRLRSFASQNSEITVTVSSSGDDVSIDGGLYDLVFTRQTHTPDAFEEISLGREKFRPLISPELLDSLGYPKKPQELLKLPIIRSEGASVSWETWLSEAGVSNPIIKETMVFENAALSLDAAEKGFGIILESNLLSAEAETAGKLVPIFPEYQLDGREHRLMWREKRRAEPKIRAFREWFESQLHYDFVDDEAYQPVAALVE
ncbi:Glycine cleavage system transcriptional activator [Pseudovibrio axinellae]|uniref:Glycine cleavage system transcriptional activator n=1 Tax=Pseudovibrio axinellae TaxID=989403 RepID=A0A166A4V0_9HYPH|nr:LysR substrate-binding domain-containing protein [Pseudovibrio axinellae]KZL20624.1 Glycine cleavage system transcriptional activator [Pseudovibrio axinellae]SER27565.1 transcriptional regulator, LysR family [Pseudovibrio axinellae]